jgi:hypothetical protein
MTTFNAAAATALERPAPSLGHGVVGVYSYNTMIRLDVATNGRNAPVILSRLFGQMQLSEPTIASNDSQCNRIDNDDLPKDKVTFDEAFTTTTKRNALHCHLVILSTRTFHQVKVGM